MGRQTRRVRRSSKSDGESDIRELRPRISLTLMRATAASCIASAASPIRMHRPRQINPTGKSAKRCPSPRAKIFRFRRRANQWPKSRVPPDKRGVAHVTKRCGGMRWTWVTARDERLSSRTAKSCGPSAPTLASSSRVARFSGVKVARKPGHLGEREVNRKPSRRESRRCSGSPVVLPPCFFVARGPWVQSAPAFPAPSPS